MTLQQLRYLIAIAENGSISSAAHSLFVSQSSLSVAVKEVENEIGVQIFQRTNRGITLTSDGVEFLGYARQVVEQADLMNQRYSGKGADLTDRLAVTTQHYAFTVEAFLAFIENYGGSNYNFTLRETRTADVIEDVRDFRSDIGILYLDDYNEKVLTNAMDEANLTFKLLFTSLPHVFVGEHHPLAKRKLIKMKDLENYPRYCFEQGTINSFFYSEEPLSELPCKRQINYSDRGTLSNLLTHHNGYTVSTGVLSSEMHSGIASIPLDSDREMRVGYILHRERKPSKLVQGYIDALLEQVKTLDCKSKNVK